MSTLERAIEIATEAHRGQFDKAGNDYIGHPLRVMAAGKTTEEKIVGVLHDVVEDTDTTLEDLKAMGFPDRVIEVLALLTHAPEVPYMDYVRAISCDSIAKKVKIADLKHNSDVSRLDVIDKWAIKRNEKYKEALRLLEADDR